MGDGPLDSIGSDVKSLLVQLDEADFPYWEFYRLKRWDVGRTRWLLLLRTDQYLAATREGWADRGPEDEEEIAHRLDARSAEVVELTAEMLVDDDGVYHLRRSWTPDPDEESVTHSVNTTRTSAARRQRETKLPLVKATQHFVTTRNS